MNTYSSKTKSEKVIILSRTPEEIVELSKQKKAYILVNCLPKDFEGWVYIYCRGGDGTLLRTKKGYKIVPFNDEISHEEFEKADWCNYSIIGRFYFKNGLTYTLQRHRYFGDEIFRHLDGGDYLSSREERWRDRLTKRTGFTFDELWNKGKKIKVLEPFVIQRDLNIFVAEDIEMLDEQLRFSDFRKYRTVREDKYAVAEQQGFILKPPKNWMFAWKDVALKSLLNGV